MKRNVLNREDMLIQEIREAKQKVRSFDHVSVCRRKKKDGKFSFFRRKWVDGKVKESKISEKDYNYYRDNNIFQRLWSKKLKLLERLQRNFSENSRVSVRISREMYALQVKLSHSPEAQDLMPGDNRTHQTLRGEKVRSKSEEIIANLLYNSKIYYKYEEKALDESVLPDFTIYFTRNGRTLYWEHSGMLSNRNYLEKFLQKLDLYSENGIEIGEKLLITREYIDEYGEQKAEFSSQIVQWIIDQTLMPAA